MSTNPNPIQTAEDNKNKGNSSYSVGNFTEAITFYSTAIALNPTKATYYTNRALCYFKLQQWQLTVTDCEKGIGLDSQLVKAYYLMGQSLIEMKDYDLGINILKEGINVSKNKENVFSKEMQEALFKGKRLKWDIEQELKQTKQNELSKFINKMISEYRDSEVAKHLEIATSGQLTPEGFDLKLHEINNTYNEKQSEVYALFAKLEDKNKDRLVPEHYCCKITFDIMKDPVITLSGITYERAAVENYLKRNSCEPITRVPMTLRDLIPNIAIREAIEQFVEQNPWAIS